jgi:general stress protein 26
VVFTVDANSVKAKALAREPRVSLCVDDEVPPYAFVLVEGTATVVDDPEAQLRWATRIGARYMGPTAPTSSAAATPPPPSC